MFATNQMVGLDFAFPDVCKTPPALIPIPYPDLAFPMAAIPVAINVLFNSVFAHNMATQIPVTVGDLPGVAMGLISQTVSATSRRVLMNSYTTLVFGTPANRMGCGGPQNNINTVGFTVVPSCPNITILAA
ncbi:DUF4150 domain-containing protein [Taylorella asinigenitalis]|uniref:Uncharacterized protein n=1 Tax=Taylorella asinigenitalis (strain MCE3) TaxID=1008459 RepID=G4QBY4_TAYAM|nr:DUF4150 domain-containing protein [Taylorella asinigenitalis]AEP36800.1 hypothetical protein TASI_1041 [Taylorella asinigenitalis MCE3]